MRKIGSAFGNDHIWLSWRDILLLLIGGTVGLGTATRIHLWTREKRP